ncbi:TetR/AcrR family transcriptional regulator [uncultured Ruminococcus sp.]|uniref:TetR/AcrR family transcriptional regulator n=1 Tax=uncultured Ruminococcus sp. TaxID=165186 RepID=UPI002930B7AE|nr:TetR/AcrR family transcriptional regulator [uncultured Ruminococcus sp.]
MAVKRPDRRTMKTKNAIFTALAELMTEKEIRHITVQDISDKADIHRVTFYKHFLDIYDVYEQLTKIILSEVGVLLTQHDEKPPATFYYDILNYVSEHTVYFKMIFSPHNTSRLYQNLLKLFIGYEALFLSEQLGPDYPESVLTCVIRYHVNGCFAVIADWVTTDLEYPQEYIVKTLSELDKSIHAYLRSQQT